MPTCGTLKIITVNRHQEEKEESEEERINHVTAGAFIPRSYQRKGGKCATGCGLGWLHEPSSRRYIVISCCLKHRRFSSSTRTRLKKDFTLNLSSVLRYVGVNSYPLRNNLIKIGSPTMLKKIDLKVEENENIVKYIHTIQSRIKLAHIYLEIN